MIHTQGMLYMQEKKSGHITQHSEVLRGGEAKKRVYKGITNEIEKNQESRRENENLER